MKTLTILILLTLSTQANAACRWIWSDHDYNASTPAKRVQVCDSTIDIPAIKTPSIRPIQSPSIKPIQIPSIPPIGTSRCRTERMYINGKWVNRQVCT